MLLTYKPTPVDPTKKKLIIFEFVVSNNKYIVFMLCILIYRFCDDHYLFFSLRCIH